MLVNTAVFGGIGTDPAATFLYALTQKRAHPQAVFLIDRFVSDSSLSIKIERSDRLRWSRPHQIVFRPSRSGSTASSRHKK